MIAVLAGGVGAARFLVGLNRATDPSSIIAVVNTADDTVMHGLHVSPDLDTVTYTLAGAIDPERGWGLRGESWRAMESLGRYLDSRPASSAAGGTWFALGDTDLATHLYRTGRIAEGATLTEVTDEIRRAWGVQPRILPMSDDRVRTLVTLADGREVEFQEYFVGMRHEPAVASVRFAGAQTARPTFVAELETAERIVVAPSNPFVSIAPIRALAGVDDALRSRRDDVVAVSPIVGGAALKGPAARMFADFGLECSALGVARHYASICSSLVVDRVDEHLAPAIESEGVRCIVTDTIMSTPDVARSLAMVALEGR